MIDQARIRRLVPHAGSMCLLEQATHWDRGSITCLTQSHRDPANPLRRGGQLPALHLVEYCAQAMALHRGLLDEADGQPTPPGWLVAVRDFHLHQQRLDLLPQLVIHARELLYFGGGVQYEVRAEVQDEAGGRLVGSGRISAARAPG